MNAISNPSRGKADAFCTNGASGDGGAREKRDANGVGTPAAVSLLPPLAQPAGNTQGGQMVAQMIIGSVAGVHGEKRYAAEWGNAHVACVSARYCDPRGARSREGRTRHERRGGGQRGAAVQAGVGAASGAARACKQIEEPRRRGGSGAWRTAQLPARRGGAR